MKFCQHCGKEVNEEAVVCLNCGRAISNPPANKPAEADEVSVGLCVLSFFVPLFGVIYWPLKHKETPKKAKACGITALVSWGVSLLFSIIYGAVLGSVLGSMM